MKKTRALLVLMGLVNLVFSQTDINATCYGWNGLLSEAAVPPTATMPGYDQETIDAENRVNDLTKDHPWQFGYKYKTDFTLTNSGQWTDVTGGKIWRLGIECPKALTINLLLHNFYIPEGATLYLYDKKRTNKIGAYTSGNNNAEKALGTELVHGDHIIIEYFEPTAVAGQGHFTIGNVVHGYRGLGQIQKDLAKALNDSGPCNIDVNCDLGDDWKDQIRSVAMIVVDGSGICSGALVNNTCEDGKTYFLTANHCLGGSTAFWSFRFNWESPEGTESCAEFGPSTDPGTPYDQTANGATVIASGTIADFALLRIDNMTLEHAEDWSCYYAGWDNSDDESVTETVGIHHPRGDVKKICKDNNAPTHDFAAGAEVWWIDDWDEGVTEPGSSGSPLFDQNKRIIGQLYGGLAACSGIDDNDEYDYYGRFGVSWVNGISDSLAPETCGGDVAILDGWDPVFSCDGTLATSVMNETCFESLNGSIDVSVEGGIAPFTYNIGDGPVDSGLFNDLGAGEYTVTVTDGTGCTEDVTLVITSPSALEVTYTTTYEIEGSDGTIDVTVTGGVPEYTFSWSGPDGFTSMEEDPEGLVSGLYTLTVTDENGCTLVESDIEVPSALGITSWEPAKLQVYPNPSNGQFILQNKSEVLEKLIVYDVTGRPVLEMPLNGTETNILIDLNNKANGTYWLSVYSQNKNWTQPIVKY